MINNEQIVAELKKKRDKDAKQVSDKWIAKRAERLMSKVTEETVLEELIADSLDDLVDAQHAINSFAKEEAKKTNKPTDPPTPPNPNDPNPPTPPTFELPDEVKEIMKDYKERKAKEIIEAKKSVIFEKIKPKVNEKQQKALQLLLDKEPIGETDDDDVVGEKVLRSFTEFHTSLIGESGVETATTTTTTEDKAAHYKKLGADLR